MRGRGERGGGARKLCERPPRAEIRSRPSPKGGGESARASIAARRDDRQAQGHRRFLRRRCHHPRRQRRRLPGALLGAHLAGIAGHRRTGDAVDRDACARRSDTAVRFFTEIEREWFRLLQTVQGVGAKVALAVLGTLKPADLASAIAMRDKAMVARTPGVGPKVAERIVTELKDKAPAYTDVDPALVRLSGALDDKRAPRPVTDAVSALVNLGYAQAQAAAAIAVATRSAGEDAEATTLIRLGLRELAK